MLITRSRAIIDQLLRSKNISMSVQLREYQKEAVKSVVKEFQQGSTSQLIVLPTGAGKSIIVAAVAHHFKKKTLIIAHRQELITQMKEKILLYWPEANIGICKAAQNEIDAPIVIASIQSASQPKRLEQLKKTNIEVLIIDEAHHASADSYLKLITELGFKDSGKLLLGVTATPARADGKGIDEIFKTTVFSRDIATMINEDYLSRVIGRKIETHLSLRGLPSHAGDFAVGQLSSKINVPSRNQLIVSKFQEHAHNRKAVAFCADVQHCKDLAATFNHYGFKAAAVWGSMDKAERASALSAFNKGDIQVVTSCGILTEGFDEPTIEAIIMARPTKSRSLYIQCIGRGLRKHITKKDCCLVLDFTDAHHNLKSIMSLATIMPPKPMKPAEKTIKQPEFRTPAQVVEKSDAEFDILGLNSLIWIQLDDDQYSLTDDNNQEIVIIPRGLGYVAVRPSQDKELSITGRPMRLDYCVGAAEDYARKNMQLNYATKNSDWHKMSRNVPATDGQRKFLTKHNLFKQGMSKEAASYAIRKYIALDNQKSRSNTARPLIYQRKDPYEKSQKISGH
jgi:ATP-dependent helicase IRC3